MDLDDLGDRLKARKAQLLAKFKERVVCRRRRPGPSRATSLHRASRCTLSSGRGWTAGVLPLRGQARPAVLLRAEGNSNARCAAQPAELAPAYVMLADPLSSYTSGATIAVTGGRPFLQAAVKRNGHATNPGKVHSSGMKTSPATSTPPAEPARSPLTPEREYERLNPGAGGPPGQQQERGKAAPSITRDDGGAGIPGSQNEDVKHHRPRGPRGAST
jgi:hypothetical protein